MAKVLIVDDTSAMRALIRTLVTSLGSEVIGEAENGELGVQMFTELNPDLVLLDIEMPIKSGIEALHEILTIDSFANIVMMTSVNNADVIDECLFSGARDYIRKDKPQNVISDRLAEELIKFV